MAVDDGGPLTADAGDEQLKLLMIIIESEHKEELEVLLNRNRVLGYTEIPHVHGVGASGTRMGSRAFPKTSSILFTVIPAAAVGPLMEDIETHCEACMRKLKMVVWGVERVV